MDYKIPLFDLNFDEQEELAVVETIRSKWISTGPKTAEFESMFAGMLHVDHAVALANCTVALHLALIIAGIEAGDEVICPSLTFVATANSIRYLNAVPIFADITSFENPTIDPRDVEKKITSRTKAIIVMHYGGFSCNMEEICTIAKKHELKIIEDACHGPLSEYKGKKLGTIGDIGCFSFFSNKNISTGEGGMLVTNNQEYFETAKLLRSHGMTSISYERAKGHSTKYDVVALGYNYRMDDIHSAIGVVQLGKIENDLRERARIRKTYLSKLDGTAGLIIPFSNYAEFCSNYIFPVILKDSTSEYRDQVRDKLALAGIQTSVHYPVVHRFAIYRDYYLELPKSDYMTENTITLPMYSKLTDTTIEFICGELICILRQS